MTQFVDVLELKMTATRDLLVCRTEALVVDGGDGGVAVASQLEDAYKALSGQVQTLMVAVGMEDARTGTFSAKSASSQSGVVGGGEISSDGPNGSVELGNASGSATTDFADLMSALGVEGDDDNV